MKTLNKRICSALICALMLLSLLPTKAFAQGNIDTDRDVYLQIHYQYQYGSKDTELVQIPNTQFDIYCVATVNASCTEFTLTDEFKRYQSEITGMDKLSNLSKDDWYTLASNLSTRVLVDKVIVTASGRTDVSGRVKLPGSSGVSLKQGLYLVMGKKSSYNGYTYQATPFLICLPNRNNVENTWDYTVNVYPKSTRHADNTNDTTITRRVIKIWNDTGNETNRPTEVTVKLLKDGVVEDTVTLNKSNNWSHTWNGLSQKNDWSVVENSVNQYSASVKEEGITFAVTNTYTTNVPDEPIPFNPVNPDEPVPSEKHLPQTGMLWWPVPVIAAMGLILLTFGIAVRKRKKDK